MDTQNRLLAMLNSATSPPPSQKAQSNSRSPPPPTSSRVPSTSSPPPTLQAVSLQDLFKAMSPPPAQQQKQEGSLPPQQEQQAKLLGMLQGLGGPPSAAPARMPSGSGRVASGVSTHDVAGVQGRKVTLMPKSSPANAPLQEPVITHPSGSPAPSSTPAPPPGPPSTAISPPLPSKAPDVAAQASRTPPEPPKKSIFDFVSPFDVFDKPKSTPKPSPPAPAQKKKEEEKPIPDLPASKRNGVASTAASSSPKKQTSPSKPASRAVMEASALGRQPSSSSISSAASGSSKQDLGLVWQVSKVVGKGVKGQGPKRLSAHTVIDLSKPNVNSLVNSPGSVQVAPFTIMKAESVGFTQGRTVGITASWVAYALPKGRVRLIDSASGAKLVLQVPPSARAGPVLDTVVTPTSVAIAAADGSVTVFQVPSKWDKDDPPCEMILHIAPDPEDLSDDDENEEQSGIGPVKQVEWVRKDGSDWLAIGGAGGVVVIKPSAYRGIVNIPMADVVKSNKVLKTDGTFISFSLNHSHQAIGLLSASSHFSLYSVATLNRVWHRQIPSPAPKKPPSSVQFCESNILVGRANNTRFDLVQITSEIVVLSRIDFAALSPSPPNLHFAQAKYDSTRNILWVAPFSRGSLYGFRYALKGQSPVKGDASGNVPTIVAFDKVAEFPLEPVLSFVVADRPLQQDAEIFFATPNGFKQAGIAKAVCDELRKPGEFDARAESVKSDAPLASPKKEPNGTPSIKQSSKQPSPIKVKSELPTLDNEPEMPAFAASNSARDVNQQATVPRPMDAALPDAAVVLVGISAEELNRALKGVEDRLSNHFKQLLSNQIGQIGTRIDAITPGDIAADVSSNIEKQIEATMATSIQQEIKRSVPLAISATLSNEVRVAVSNAVPVAIEASLRSVSADLEKGLASLVQRMVAEAVQSSTDRVIQECLQQTLPAISNATSRLGAQLSADLQSELIQMRKDLEPPTTNQPMFQSMLASVSDLQKQVANLSEQLARSGPPSGPSRSAPPPVPMNHPPPKPQLPSASQLEDVFLAALGIQSTGATLQLVNEHMALYDYILPPSPSSKSPLSQAVLLTLLHRLALALNELAPADTAFSLIASWERRIASQLDPLDSGIASFLPRVITVVQGVLGTVLQNLQTRFSNDPHAGDHMRVIRGILYVVAQKAQ